MQLAISTFFDEKINNFLMILVSWTTSVVNISFLIENYHILKFVVQKWVLPKKRRHCIICVESALLRQNIPFHLAFSNSPDTQKCHHKPKFGAHPRPWIQYIGRRTANQIRDFF